MQIEDFLVPLSKINSGIQKILKEVLDTDLEIHQAELIHN